MTGRTDNSTAATEESALKASADDQLRLLDLQALDARVDRLAHRRRTLPELAEHAQLETRIGQLRDLLVTATAAEADIATEQKKAEADVDQVRARADRDQQRLDSGNVGSPRELENLQHEIGSLAKRQSDLEDVVLETMERREVAQQRVVDLTAQAQAAEEKRGELQATLDAARGEIDAEDADLAGRRAAVAEPIPADLLALYEKMRASSGGVGAAMLRQGRCEGCRLELDISERNAIKAAARDDVVRCESCRRILVRTAESGL